MAPAITSGGAGSGVHAAPSDPVPTDPVLSDPVPLDPAPADDQIPCAGGTKPAPAPVAGTPKDGSPHVLSRGPAAERIASAPAGTKGAAPASKGAESGVPVAPSDPVPSNLAAATILVDRLDPALATAAGGEGVGTIPDDHGPRVLMDASLDPAQDGPNLDGIVPSDDRTSSVPAPKSNKQ